VQHIQRSAFSGGKARYSHDIGATNSDGTTAEVSLNAIANNTFSPTTHNTINLGDSSYYWKTGYITSLYTVSHRQDKLSDTASDSSSRDVYRKKANGTTATANLDRIMRDTYYGYSGSADYMGAYIQVVQRANFSGGNARFSYDITARNGADGSESQVSLNGMANKSCAPYPDNSIALGDGSFRWTTVYAVTGTINAYLSIEPKQYRWKDAVAEKGDAARIHMGYIAQELMAALASMGKDPAKYAIWCEDEINEAVVVVADDGTKTIYTKPTGVKRQALRYDQFIALMEAANRRRFSDIERRIAALELP
jgi:hypothetical protein